MIKIPDKGKYSVPNNSDLFGNIWYTKNINFDEEGYIKLAPRTVSLISEKDDGNMELPLAFGRTASADTVSFNVVTSEDPFLISIATSGVTATQDTDTGVPVCTLDSHGRWYRNLWHITDDNDFFSKSGTTYTDRGNLTSGKAHPIEVFRNRDTICIGNGNVVSQFDNTYGASTNLTLPTDFEVVSLSYSNYQMGVLTILSDTTTGQNQDAYFFVWKGTTTDAGQGVPIGSDRALAIVAYKGSWVILTRTGQLIYWTGGGFQELAALPFYYRDLVFGTSYQRDLFGDILLVEGDVIYINFNGLMTSYGKNYEKYLQNNPGGILCYDPNIGIYQRYSHSISPVSLLTVTNANVNTTTDILTKTAGTIPSTGSPIKYVASKSTPIGGLKTPTVYYCIKLSSTTFQLATSKELAVAGVAIDLTSVGDTNNYFLALEVYDYGTTLANNVGGLALVGTDNSICNHLISGVELNDFDSTNQWNHINFVASGFENRGYAITSKITSDNVEDKLQKIFSKFRPLKSGDKILVKYKNKDLIGLPVSTPQFRTSSYNQCNWTGANSFYTTADLTDAKTAFDDGEQLECEIIAGAGAGSMVKIIDLTESDGTYVVTLEENVDGAAAGRYCDIIIDNWTLIGSITSTDTNGYKQLSVAKNAPWTKFKIELRGTDTTIEESQFINKSHLPAK